MRRVVNALLVLAVFASCSGPSAAAVISNSSAKARDKGGARMEMSFVISGGSGAASFRSVSTGSGAFDFERHRGRLVMRVGGMPGGPATPSLETVTDGSQVYFKCPDGRWVKFDASKLSGVDPNAFGSDPATTLDFVKSVSGEVEEVGREEVRDAGTTHYRFTATVDELLEQVRAEARERQRQSFRQMGVTSVPFDVWIDDDGLPRRMVMKMAPSSGTSGANLEMTLEMFDYGRPVEVSVPSATQVLEHSDDAGTEASAALTRCFSSVRPDPTRASPPPS
jgi:hypothetical protein